METGSEEAVDCQRVLLVEDDFLKARAITRMLKILGVQVFHVKNAREALEAIRTTKLRAVLCDWNFPPDGEERPTEGMGSRVADECRERGVPCMVVSGSSKPDSFRGPWLTFRPDPKVRSEVEGFISSTCLPSAR